MKPTARIRRAFSMIEMVLVITIVGIIAAIAMPKFADASTGRVLINAEKLIREDIENVTLRARATNKIHTIVFYPDREFYCVFEGTDIKRDAIVLSNDLSLSPYELDLVGTNLTDDFCIVTAFGEVQPGFTLRIQTGGIAKNIIIAGSATRDVSADVSTPLDDLLPKTVDAVGGVLDALGLGR